MQIPSSMKTRSGMRLRGSKTGQVMQKSADLAAGNSATPLAATQMLPGFEGNLAITAPAPEDGGASTKEGKQQLLLAKKIKYASKCFNSLLQHLAKCWPLWN